MRKLALPVVLVTLGLLALLVTLLAAPMPVYAEPPQPASPQLNPDIHHFTYLPTLTRVRIYEDDFSNPGSGWPVGSERPSGFPYRSSWGYVGGTYQIAVGDEHWEYWVDAPVPPLDCPYAVEVDMRRVAGGAEPAVTFDVQDDGSMYVFYLYPLGGLWELYYYRGSDEAWYYLRSGIDSHVLRGGATNRVRVERDGTSITAYVNGYEVCAYSHGALSGGGVGLDCYARDTPLPAVASFDNLRVIWMGPSTGPLLAGGAASPSSTEGSALRQPWRRP